MTTTGIFRGYRLNYEDFLQIPEDKAEELKNADYLFQMNCYDPQSCDYILGEICFFAPVGNTTKVDPTINFGEMDSRVKEQYLFAYGKMPEKEPNFYLGSQVY